MHAMVDMAKDVAIVEAIRAIGFTNDLADRAKFGILPFSSVPNIDPDAEAAIPFSSLYAYIDEFGWHFHEDSRRRDLLPHERQKALF